MFWRRELRWVQIRGRLWHLERLFDSVFSVCIISVCSGDSSVSSMRSDKSKVETSDGFRYRRIVCTRICSPAGPCFDKSSC